MVVVLFIDQLRSGGAQRQLINLANGLSSAGIEVDLITIFPGGMLLEELNESTNLTYESLWKKKANSKIVRFFQVLFSPMILRIQISRINPDVTYSFLFLTNIIAWLATRGRYGKKLVWGLRSTKMELSIIQYIPDLFSKIVSPSVTLIIVNSKSGLNYFLEWGYQAQYMISIPNGIDTAYFNIMDEQSILLRKELGLSLSDTVIGHIGRFHSKKNHEGFIESSLLLMKKFHNIYFVLVGNEVNSQNRLLMDLIPYNHKDRFHLLGERNDISAILNSLNCLCSSSVEGEGFPNVIAEAMACGVPCIVTDVGDSARIVNDPGCVVPPGDPEALAAAMAEFLSADHPQDYRYSLRKRIVDNYSVDMMVQQTIDAFIKYIPAGK